MTQPPPGLTPSQTVGPFLAIGLPWPDGPHVVPPGTPGAITIAGRVTDGAGEPVPDALVETWQADPDGAFAHPDWPGPDGTGPDGTGPDGTGADSTGADSTGADSTGADSTGFRGFGRCPTDADGRFEIVTLRPGRVPAPGGGLQAPHLDVSVFARGLLDRVVTRIYLAGEDEANAADPVLAVIPDDARRSTLIALRDGAEDRFRFDIRLQGKGETVFFDV